MKLSVVIPCYNEEESLPTLVARVDTVCRAAAVDSYEIVLIDDGSTDRTWSIINAALREVPAIVGVSLARNHGQQLALSAGLKVAGGDRILILDADLQDPPELLDRMMAVMDRGADVVYGQRVARKGETIVKRLTSSGFYRVLNTLTEVDIPNDTGDFRLLNRRVLAVLNEMPEAHRFIRGMISWIGFNQVALPYERDERFAGDTKYPLSKLFHLAVDAITGFSTKPLKLASYFGFFFGALGLLCLLYVFASWVSSNTIRGWTSLITIVLLLGSAQLIVLGVIGEYIGRLYIESKQRPVFTIKDIVRGTSLPPSTFSDDLRALENSAA